MTQKICDKAVNTYHFTIKFVPDWYNSVNSCFLAFIFILDRYKAQEMCDRIISEDPFMLVYCRDRHKSNKMCDEAIDDCLLALKFIPDWFVTSKMIKKLLTTLYTDDNILYFNEDSGDVIFSCNEDDPETIIHFRLLAWHSKFGKRKAFKKELNEELVLVTWHPLRCWDWYLLEDEKKEKEPFFTK